MQIQLNYEKDGRMTVLLALGKYIVSTYPTKAEAIGLTNRQYLKKMLNERLEKEKNKARVAIEWRTLLASKLMLNENEVLRATNTIIEMIEGSLAKGEPVRIKYFGDLTLVETRSEGVSINTVRFKTDAKWLKELNPVTSETDLGLKRHYSRRLVRRALPESVQAE